MTKKQILPGLLCVLVWAGSAASGTATVEAASGAHGSKGSGWAVMFKEKYKRKYFNGTFRVKGQIAQVCASQDGHHCKPGGKQKHVRHGVWTWFWFNGKKKAERRYALGHLEGLAKAWYPNGQERWEEHYKGGKLEGERRVWFANGTLKSKTHYHHGKRHGIATSWWWNGKKASAGSYEKGKKVGAWTAWYVSGHRKSLSHYKDNKQHGRYILWWFICRPSGCGKVKIQEGFFSKGQKTGRWTYNSLNANGALTSSTETY